MHWLHLLGWLIHHASLPHWRPGGASVSPPPIPGPVPVPHRW